MGCCDGRAFRRGRTIKSLVQSAEGRTVAAGETSRVRFPRGTGDRLRTLPPDRCGGTPGATISAAPHDSEESGDHGCFGWARARSSSTLRLNSMSSAISLPMVLSFARTCSWS